MDQFRKIEEIEFGKIDNKQEGRIIIGGLKNRSMGAILQDVRNLETMDRWMLIRERDVWKIILREARAH